jgi:regulator of sigma E protease
MPPDLLHSLFSSVWSIFLVIFFFGGSIFVHELGHFLVARRRGVHVERFSIGFGPAIFSWRGKDNVEYRLSWIPLGGYVLLPQLADLSPIEGRSAVSADTLPSISYLSRMLVFTAGAFFNLLFALVLATIVWAVGQPTFAALRTTKIGNVVPTVTLADGKVVPNPAAEAGLRQGDEIKTIDGQTVTDFEDILNAVFLGKGRTAEGRRESLFVIQREGRTLPVTVYPLLLGDEQYRVAGVEPAEDLTADGVMPGSPAEAAGLQGGDRIISVDGEAMFNRSVVSEHLAQNSQRPNIFVVARGTRVLTFQIQPRMEPVPNGQPIARIGLRYRENIIVIHPTPWSQLAENAQKTFRTLSSLLSPTSDVGPSKLSSPVGIARAFYEQAQWDIRRVLWFTILVNVNLAIFNLLPIPVLDGGQMLFATISRLRRRDLPPNIIIGTQSAFFVMLMSLIVYVGYHDVRRWARDIRTERAEARAAQPVPAPAPAKP